MFVPTKALHNSWHFLVPSWSHLTLYWSVSSITGSVPGTVNNAQPHAPSAVSPCLEERNSYIKSSLKNCINYNNRVGDSLYGYENRSCDYWDCYSPYTNVTRLHGTYYWILQREREHRNQNSEIHHCQFSHCVPSAPIENRSRIEWNRVGNDKSLPRLHRGRFESHRGIYRPITSTCASVRGTECTRNHVIPLLIVNILLAACRILHRSAPHSHRDIITGRGCNARTDWNVLAPACARDV